MGVSEKKMEKKCRGEDALRRASGDERRDAIRPDAAKRIVLALRTYRILFLPLKTDLRAHHHRLFLILRHLQFFRFAFSFWSSGREKKITKKTSAVYIFVYSARVFLRAKKGS